MKRIFALILSLFCFFMMFDTVVIAAVFADDMSKLDGSNAKSYQNLNIQLATGSWAELPDNTFLGMQNTGVGRAAVVYRLKNANNVRISSYSSTGTTVYRNEQGDYVIGGGNDRISTGIQAKYSPINNSVYIMAEGKAKYLTYDRRKGYIFKDTDNYPQDLIPYGVALWTSVDGQNYQLASQSKTGSIFYGGAQVYGEHWSASISSNVKYLKVEINDVPYLEAYDGGVVYPKISTTMTMLANVDIQGENLIIGVPEPIKSESTITSEPSQESVTPETSKEGTSSMAKKATSKTKVPSVAVPATVKEPVSSKQETQTSKFEGDITISSSKKSSSTNKTPPKTTNSTSSTTKESTSSVVEIPEQPVYYIEGEKNKDEGFSKFVVAYIIGISMLILFVLLRPNKK